MEKKVGFFIKAYGQTINDTQYISQSLAKDLNIEDTKSCIEVICREIWGCYGGWEWLRTGTVITLVYEDKEIDDFDIEVNCIPEFMVTKLSRKC